MAAFQYQQKIERMYYRHGMFTSSHPIIMIFLSAVIILCCCYPLLNLPLPGCEPMELSTPLSDFKNEVYAAGKDLPYNHFKMPTKLPTWFESDKQVAYVQQFLVKSIVHPWNEKEMIVSDAFKAPLAKIFTLLEEIENFHLEEDENHSITKECFHVSESIIKPKKSIKPLFPEYGCLVLSPAMFWRKNSQSFRSDSNILHTIHKYQVKAIETSPSVKDLLFGVPSKESGVNNFIVRNRQRVITYAITVVLKEYDDRLISSLRKKFKSLYPSKFAQRCKDGTNCENSSDSGGDMFRDDPVITHVHFKPQISSKDLIPLLSTYFIMGCYIYFSVRKINFVKSKLGMAFSAVVSIMASLMMSVGLCSLFGLKPTLNGGEIFPYLVIVIGLENILVITKSVVATPLHLEVDKRVALGLSREGCSITKNLFLELILIGLGYFTFIPEIQEFCAFAVVGVLTDYFMHIVFFTTVLSIDIRRLDISEDMYSQTHESDSDSDDVRYPNSINHDRNHSMDAKPGRKRSVLEHLRASTIRRQRKNSDEIHKAETGGKRVTILKIPKRLRVLFFWADTRMVQRGLMVCMVIWFALLMYGDPLGENKANEAVSSNLDYKFATRQPVAAPLKESHIVFKKEEEAGTVIREPIDPKGNLLWKSADLQLYRRLSFRHWPTLFAYYNITLAGKFVSILPTIPLTLRIPPEEVIKERSTNEGSRKHDSAFSDTPQQEENVGQQFTPNYYPMTGLDYYLTLLFGAVSGMMMVFLLTVMYRCVCSRNYANWRIDGKHRRRQGTAKYKSSVGDAIPLVLSGHPQVVDCVICDDNLLASTDLSGEIRVWDIHTGTCNCVIRRVAASPVKRNSAEGTIDTMPTLLDYQENDEFSRVQATPIREGHHRRQKSWHESSSMQHSRRGSSPGVNIPSSSNHHHATRTKSVASPFSHEVNYSFSINTDFSGEAEKKFLSRRRATSNSSILSDREDERADYDRGATGYDFEGVLRDYCLSQVSPSSEISSLGNLARLFKMDGAIGSPLPWSRSRSLSQPSLAGPYSLGACNDSLISTSSPQSMLLHAHGELTNSNDVSPHLACNLSPYSPGSGDILDDLCMYEAWGSDVGQMSPSSLPGSQGSSPGSPAEMENGPSVWCMVGVQDLIITGCEDGRIEVWDGHSGALKCTHDVGKDGVIGLVAEEKKVVAARVNGSLDFFEMGVTSAHVNTVQYRGPVRTRHSPSTIDETFSGDVLSLQLLSTTKSAHQQPITAFKMAMGRVVTGSCDHTLKVFTIQDARCLFTLYGHKAPISSVFLDRGPPAWAASGSSDGTIRVWDLLSGKCLHMLDDHKAEVTSVQCSDTHIVSIAQDDQLCIWTRTGVLLHVRCLDPGCSVDMCLLGNSWCVTGGTGHVLLWDLRNGELVRRIKLTEEAAGLASRVTKLVPVANLAVACDTGKELQIVCFPSVLEKID